MEKPILFSTQMVRAILEGRKTQTRRVIARWKRLNGLEYWGDACCRDGYREFAGDGFFSIWLKPQYQPGDILWVREAFFHEPCRPTCPGREDEGECPFNRVNDVCYGYREQYADEIGINIKWSPSIHMPRAAARLFLRVTRVSAEYLQEISEDDAVAEGCLGEIPGTVGVKPIEEYRALWDSLNAKRGCGWDTNPRVWVYDFEVVDLAALKG